jgi:hypothetical protein
VYSDFAKLSTRTKFDAQGLGGNEFGLKVFGDVSQGMDEQKKVTPKAQEPAVYDLTVDSILRRIDQ